MVSIRESVLRGSSLAAVGFLVGDYFLFVVWLIGGSLAAKVSSMLLSALGNAYWDGVSGASCIDSGLVGLTC